jgi:hypothetical protein
MADQNEESRPDPVPEPREKPPREHKPLRESDDRYVFGTRREKDDE